MKLLTRWISHPGAVLVLGALLAGCATVPGKPRALGGIPPSGEGSRARLLLASSDGPTISGGATGQSVQGYTVPGRKPDSQAPWEFFLGNAAHRLIAYMYGVNHPQNEVFYNQVTLLTIVSSTGIGSAAQLMEQERNLRPDITDISALSVFEIKPLGEQGRQEGLQEVQLYLLALNRAAEPGLSFVPGTGFQGEMLIRFAQGQYIWRLEWQTTEPGVVQYRWTRSQQRFESAAEASDSGQWVALTEQEMRRYGGWVGQAVEGMVKRRE